VIVPFVALLMTSFASAAIIGQRRPDRVNRAFLLYSLCCIGWLFLETLTYLPVSLGREPLLLRAMGLFWIPLGLAVLNLAYALLDRRHDGPFWACLGFTLAGLVAGFIPGVTFTDFERQRWGISLTLNPIGFALALTPLLGAACYGLWLIWRRWRAEPKGALRRPITIGLIGAAVTTISASLLNFILPLVLDPSTVPRAGAATTIVFTFSILFAMTHYPFLSGTVESMAEELFDNIHDGIVVSDPRGQILRMNRTARKLLANPDDTPSGQAMSSMLPTWNPPKENGGDGENGPESDRTVTVVRDGRKRILSLSMLTTRQMSGVDVRVRLLRDVTEQHESQQALRDRRDALETEARHRTADLTRVQRLEAISTLAAGIAHVFNNLLAVIVGSTSAARDDLPQGHEARDDLDAVLRAARRGRDTVRQIMSLSQIDPPDERDIPFALLVRDTLTLLEKSLPADIRVEHRTGADRATVVGYQTQLQRAIINLYTNAVQAMHPSKGVLRINLNLCRVDVELARRHPPLNPGPHVRLRISDTGTGISPETQARIFEPFYTTKPQGKGTGLGLSTTQQIVHNHGGAITVESVVGHSTTFTIYLPSVERTSTRLVSEVMIVAGGKERILLVDDNEDVAKAGRWMLEGLGYTVVTFHSPGAALDAYRADDTFDLVITDQSMPGMSGAELATELRRLNPQLPVILVSGYMEGVAEQLPTHLNNVRFLPKPLSRDHLGTLVRELIDS
jgi:signal transduction histidine kinase